MPDNPIMPGTGLAPEPIQGDSLTQFIRGLMNFLQGQGAGTFQAGGANVNNAVAATGDAWNTAAPTVDYWKALLSGDKSKMAGAVAPTAGAINSQYDAAQRSAQTTLPRGGFSTGLASALPFQKAGAIGTLFNQLQPAAAQGLLGAAGFQGGLAGQLGQIGLNQQQIGTGLLGTAAQGQLSRRGQNANVEMGNLANLTSGLKTVMTGH